jgi:hypothetical protein
MSEISRACGGGEVGRSLVPGSLRGYRTWRPAGRRVHVPAGTLPLTSVTRRRVVWPPTLVARCAPSPSGRKAPPDPDPGVEPGEDGHHAPQPGCDCGIYAWYAPDDTRILHARVFGAVEASGLVLMGDRGFRAERVRIKAVATRNRRVAAACAKAGIAVYRRRGELIRDHPPEDLSSLLSDRSPPGGGDGDEPAEPDPPLPADRVDRTLVMAVWARTAFLALAVGLLPVAAAVICVAVAELALVGLIVSRLR